MNRKTLNDAITEADLHMPNFERLLKNGEDPNYPPYTDEIPLIQIIEHDRSVKATKLLLDYGADPNKIILNIRSRKSETVLANIISLMMRRMSSERGNYMKAYSDYFMPHLKLYFDYGADLDISANDWSPSPRDIIENYTLNLRVMDKMKEMIKKLIGSPEYGIYPAEQRLAFAKTELPDNIQDIISGNLHKNDDTFQIIGEQMASEPTSNMSRSRYDPKETYDDYKENLEIADYVKDLEQYGGRKKKKTKKKRIQRGGSLNDLIEAVNNGDYDHTKELLRKGFDVNSNKDGRTLLIRACFVLNEFPESYDIIELLLKHGANVNDRDSFGNTALKYLSIIPDDEVEPIDKKTIIFLLDNGADPYIKNNIGETALSIEETGNFKLVDIIENYIKIYPAEQRLAFAKTELPDNIQEIISGNLHKNDDTFQIIGEQMASEPASESSRKSRSRYDTDETYDDYKENKENKEIADYVKDLEQYGGRKKKKTLKKKRMRGGVGTPDMDEGKLDIIIDQLNQIIDFNRPIEQRPSTYFQPPGGPAKAREHLVTHKQRVEKAFSTRPVFNPSRPNPETIDYIKKIEPSQRAAFSQSLNPRLGEDSSTQGIPIELYDKIMSKIPTETDIKKGEDNQREKIRKIQLDGANAAAEHHRVARRNAAKRFIESISYGQGDANERALWKHTPWDDLADLNVNGRTRKGQRAKKGKGEPRLIEILNIDETEWNRRMQEQLAQQATEFPDLAARPT